MTKLPQDLKDLYSDNKKQWLCTIVGGLAVVCWFLVLAAV
jgi:hypothetical protein